MLRQTAAGLTPAPQSQLPRLATLRPCWPPRGTCGMVIVMVMSSMVDAHSLTNVLQHAVQAANIRTHHGRGSGWCSRVARAMIAYVAASCSSWQPKPSISCKHGRSDKVWRSCCATGRMPCRAGPGCRRAQALEQSQAPRLLFHSLEGTFSGSGRPCSDVPCKCAAPSRTTQHTGQRREHR